MRRTPVPVQLALAVALTALAAAQGIGGGHGVVATLTACVGTAAVALLRRAPVRGALVVAASVGAAAWLWGGEPPFGAFLATIAAFYALGRRAPLRPALATAAAVAAAVVLVGTQSPGGLSPVGLVYPAVYLGAAAAVGVLVRSREERAAAALAAAQREAEVRERAATAEQRARIAREMHDVVAHSLSLLVVQAEAAAALLPQDPSRAATAVERVSASGRQALDELRRMLTVLRDDECRDADLGPQPGLAALDALAEPVRAAGADVVLDVEPGLDELPPGLQLTAYRVVQEGLTNAVRHGGAARVLVGVHRCGGDLEVEVVDDGTGSTATSTSTGGHGLLGMRERLRAYGGRLDAGPGEDGGWRLVARAPLVPS